MQILKALCDKFNPRWVSDHVSFSRAGEYEVNNFIPVQYRAGPANEFAANVHVLSRALDGRPMAVENTCYYFKYPDGNMSEGQFLSELGATGDIPIMLDINSFL